jgi:PTH1 family peptidyl-tRNA hydrolase
VVSVFFKKEGGFTWLLVGLGNPGAKYESTRHNMGFLAVDKLAELERFKFSKLRFKAWTAAAELGGQKVLVMKPQTYMNLSGEAVGQAARFYKIPPEHVLVISDDISLPIGKVRIRSGGSAGGHNGLKSIIAHLGSDQFPRIKVGVGMPDNADYDIADWVTGRPMGDEQKPLMEALDKAVAAVPVVIRDGVDKAQNKFN